MKNILDFTTFGLNEGQLKLARKTKFYGDDTADYDGWTFDDNWNGFAVPYFEKETADKIAKELKGEFLEKENAYVFPNEDPDEKYKMQEIDTEEGKKEVWPIGAYAWTWEEVM